MRDDARDEAVETDALLAAYADDPRSLTLDERARVEALLAGDEAAGIEVARDRDVLAAVRAQDARATTDWGALEARVLASTTRAPVRRRAWLVGGALGAAALAAAVAIWLARPPGGDVGGAMRVVLDVPVAVPADEPTAPAVPDEPDEPNDDDAIARDDGSDLGGMPAIDDALVDEVLELDAADDGAGEVDDLPAIGAAWTAELEDLSDDDLDQALRWLDTREAG